MSHSHRDDQDLVSSRAAQDAVAESVVKPPAVTNAEVARAAAAARKAEDVPTPEVVRERKFIGDGDRGAARPTLDAAADEDLEMIPGRAWATQGPPPPRFESHTDQTVWLGEQRFEAVGFAERSAAWELPMAAVTPLKLASRTAWIR